MNKLRQSLLVLAKAQPEGSSFRRRLVATVQRESYETGLAEPDGWNPGTVTPSSPWSKGEGSQMPPARDLKGEPINKDSHLARMAGRLAARFVAAGKLDRGLREQVNADMRRKGLDGNGRFRRAQDGYVVAVDVMGDHGIELDGVVNSFSFKRDRGTINVNIAFTNREDLFSPDAIHNSMLHLSHTKLENDRYEVLAYLT